MSKYTIIKNIKCNTTRNPNYRGSFEYEGIEELIRTLLTYSKWELNVPKSNLPLFSCTSFNFYIKKDYANPTSLYALDFDDKGNNIDDAVEYFKQYNSFMYTTYSHTDDHHKFRVIIELDTEITNNNESHIVFKILEERLKQNNLILDKACKDITRRFFLPTYTPDGEYPFMASSSGDKVSIKEELAKELYDEHIREQEQKVREACLALDRLANPNKYKNKYNIIPYFNSLDDQNIMSKDKINNYLSLPQGSHYTAFYGMATHMRARAKHMNYQITDDMMFRALRELDNRDGGYYSNKHIYNKIRESKK